MPADTSAYTIVNRINAQYARVLRNISKSMRHIFDPAVPLETAYEMFRAEIENQVIVGVAGSSFVTPLEARVIEHLDQVKAFWDEHLSDYDQAIRQFTSDVAVSSQPRYQLAAYFDTVLVMDSLYGLSLDRDNYPRGRRVFSWFGLMRDVYKVIGLLDISMEPPPVALAIQGSLGSEGRDANRRAYVNAEELVRPLLRKGTFGDFWEEPLSTSTHEVDVDEIVDYQWLKALMQGEAAKSHDVQFTKVLADLPPRMAMKDLAEILKLIPPFIFEESLADMLCGRLRADRVVVRPGIFNAKLQLESGRLVALAQWSDQAAIVQTMRFPPLRSLMNLSPEEIVRFRDAQGLEYLRRAFAQEKRRLKFAKVEEFPEIARSVGSALSEIVREENEKLVKDETLFRKKLRTTSLSFAGSIALGIASVAAPPLAVITVPLAAWSALVGGASARDVINLVVERKRQVKEIGERPIGVVAQTVDGVDAKTTS